MIIKNGLIPDFKVQDFVKKNLIIEDGKISGILPPSTKIEEKNHKEIIDADGLIVSPGFIDTHSHSDIKSVNSWLDNPKFRQGITTEIVGNCGMSVAPVKKSEVKDLKSLFESIWGDDKYEWKWTGVESYLKVTKKNSINKIFTLLGYSTLRYYISGLSPEKFDKQKLKKMEVLIEKELSGGAMGISIGIGYAPNIFAQPEEYELIARLLKKYNKILAVHLRDEGDRVIEAIKEIMSYTEKYQPKIHISHIKSYGKQNWHKTGEIINLIDSLNKTQDISFDSYPYTAGSTMLYSLLPPALLDKPKKILMDFLTRKKTREMISQSIEFGIDNWENYGRTVGFDNVMPVGFTSKKFKKYEGKKLTEIASIIKKDVYSTLCDILIFEKLETSMIMFSMSEDNVIQFFKHPKHTVGSDGLFGVKPHPRTYGAFPRVISRFCRELKIIKLIDVLKQMTQSAANRFGLAGLGEIKKNYVADITIFDYNTIKDTAEYFEPKKYPVGLKYIIIDGKIKYSE